MTKVYSKKARKNRASPGDKAVKSKTPAGKYPEYSEAMPKRKRGYTGWLPVRRLSKGRVGHEP